MSTAADSLMCEVCRVAVTGLSKSLRKREGLTNVKERRIRNLLISRIIYAFEVSLARANVRIITVRVTS